MKILNEWDTATDLFSDNDQLTGADVIGINCCFEPSMCLKTMALMKAGLEDAGLKAYLMAQPVGFHTQDVNDVQNGYGSLPEFPFGELFFTCFEEYYPLSRTRMKKTSTKKQTASCYILILVGVPYSFSRFMCIKKPDITVLWVRHSYKMSKA